jgi:hypothetical protein
MNSGTTTSNPKPQKLSSMARKVLDQLSDIEQSDVIELTNTKLGDIMMVSPYSVSRAISELERTGYVEITWGSPNPRHGQPSGRRLKVLQPKQSN